VKNGTGLNVVNTSLTLSTAPLEHPAMDYAFLRKEGLRLIEQMAGEHWTDFNAHDPGITILEQLCYAITDLGYRINYDLPDLLAEEGLESESGLFSPAQILSTQAVTLEDLRKLVLDVEGVKNAWIERIEDPQPIYFHEGKKTLSLQQEGEADGPEIMEPIFLKGLYRVLIETSPLIDREGTQVEREVARRLFAHRGLCEDFDGITVLEHQDVSVLARIEIGPVEDPAGLLVEIYTRIAEYCSPALPFQRLEALLASERPLDEIFEGPLLKRGFLDSEALKKNTRREILYVSDLIHDIMQIKGVRAIRNIHLQSGETREEWSLALGKKQVPRLVFSAEHIVLEKDGMPVSLDPYEILSRYESLLKEATLFPELPPEKRDVIPPKGRRRKIERYSSIQQQFPALYGIGEMGLPSSASPERKARAKNLKAYLLFFDQVLANCFAQLAYAKSLFSFGGAYQQSYFSQAVPDAGLGLEDIRKKAPEAHQAVLSRLSEETVERSTATQRRNRFLNHLLARFSEQFTGYALVLLGLSDQDAKAASEHLVRDKQAFLRAYPQISSARGSAFNALKPWGSGNVSGLEARIRLKLGLVREEGEDLFLIEHILLRPVAGDEKQQLPLLSALKTKDPYSLQLSLVLPNWPDRLTKAAFRKFAEQTIREECPAHLMPHVHWLARPEWQALEKAYGEWIEKHRLFLTRKWGL